MKDDRDLYGTNCVVPIDNNRKIVNMFCLYGETNTALYLYDCLRKAYSLAKTINFSLAISHTIFYGLNRTETNKILDLLGSFKKCKTILYKYNETNTQV
jgi:hypothetical protein